MDRHVRHIGGGLLAIYEDDTFVREIGPTPGWDFKDRDEFIVRYNAALQSQQGASADRGEAVCFRFQLQTGEWSRWLSMEDLVHYGPDGNLVDGPHPDWKRVEYAYRPAATPPSPAESAAPSGVWDAMPPEAVPFGDDGLGYGVVAKGDWCIPSQCGARIVDARMAYGWNECRKEMQERAAQPQPGRVEGMDRG